MKIPKEYKNLNKYGLTPKTIKNLIPDINKIQEKPFWRNNVISAWCLSDNTIHSSDSIVYSEYAEYWLGIYDIDGKVEFNLYSYGGMCKYHPSEFLKPNEIENKDDLEIQVKFLKRINQLIDDGTFSLPNEKKGEYK